VPLICLRFLRVLATKQRHGFFYVTGGSPLTDHNPYSSNYSDLPLFSPREEVAVSAVNPDCVIESHEFDATSDSYTERLNEILDCLKVRSMSCVEVETRWHRGQAAVGSLRAMGHQIDTRRGFYVYVGFNPDMVKAKPHQQKYYETRHWKCKSAERKAFDNYRCVQCGSSENLETHHWKYDLFAEDLRDLCTLCAECHASIHDAVRGSSVHFPRYVTKQIRDRIEAENE
jgi:hypothetical protein